MPAAKLDITFGRRTRGLAGFDATFPQIVFAQLIALGYEPSEAAWVSFYGFNKLATNQQVTNRANTALRTEKVRKLVKFFQDELGLMERTGDDALTAAARKGQEGMDAEETAMELLRIANTLVDGKEKADLMMKYADLKGFKRAGADVKSDKRQVAFFLPTQCSICPCYRYALENGGEDRKPLHSSKI